MAECCGEGGREDHFHKEICYPTIACTRRGYRRSKSTTRQVTPYPTTHPKPRPTLRAEVALPPPPCIFSLALFLDHTILFKKQQSTPAANRRASARSGTRPSNRSRTAVLSRFVSITYTRVLLSGTKAQIRAEVERCMAIGKQYPGFFLAVDNHIPSNTPVDNVLHYNDVHLELSRR